MRPAPVMPRPVSRDRSRCNARGHHRVGDRGAAPRSRIRQARARGLVGHAGSGKAGGLGGEGGAEGARGQHRRGGEAGRAAGRRHQLGGHRGGAQGRRPRELPGQGGDGRHQPAPSLPERAADAGAGLRHLGGREGAAVAARREGGEGLQHGGRAADGGPLLPGRAQGRHVHRRRRCRREVDGGGDRPRVRLGGGGRRRHPDVAGPRADVRASGSTWASPPGSGTTPSS